MIQIPLVNGRTMPALGLGTWDLRGATCTAAVGEALRIGYRHIDTVEMYGDEAEIGKALKASGVPRRELFITTKVWTNHHRAKDFKKAAEDSLGRLGLSHLDLLLIHWPNPAVPLSETLGALCGLAREGKALAVGSPFPTAPPERSRFTGPGSPRLQPGFLLPHGKSKRPFGVCPRVRHPPLRLHSPGTGKFFKPSPAPRSCGEARENPGASRLAVAPPTGRHGGHSQGSGGRALDGEF